MVLYPYNQDRSSRIPRIYMWHKAQMDLQWYNLQPQVYGGASEEVEKSTRIKET